VAGESFDSLDDPHIFALVGGQAAGDALGRPAELAKHPPAIDQLILQRAAEQIDRIRLAVCALGHYATVCYGLTVEHPDVVDALPEEQRIAVQKLASLIDPTAVAEERKGVPITIKSVGDARPAPLEPQGE
jgi:hypothetical protein